MTIHKESHSLAGQRVVLNSNVAKDITQGLVRPGEVFRVEDWADRVYGHSWMDARGNFAAIHYAVRFAQGLPLDDEVVYGKIGNFGHIVHVSELGDVVTV